MKSGKQRKCEIKSSRAKRRAKIEYANHKERLKNKVLVNEALLNSMNCYGIPHFVIRGFYEDIVFKCKDCGKEEVWRDTQQKWWYEIAKGDVWTTAVRCRSCRRKERERKKEARRVHLEGLSKKHKT